MYKYSIKKSVLIGLSVLICGIMSVSLFTVPALAAVTYEGKGSKSNPYLIKTAEQLDGIRNNLSAHYKLSNTVDLSGIANFEPIGRLDKPFTGSLTCDANQDGTAKYAIKNLKIYNDAGDKNGHVKGANHYSDYVKNASKWETALFGATKGATFDNIFVLDCNITSTVVGQSQMNSDYSVNLGQDEMATAALVAIAENTKITGCGSTGTINSKSNWTGGLAGCISGSSSIKKSFSYVTVTSDGDWNTGGLLGGVSGSKGSIDGCYYSGSVKGGAYSTGGLCGVVETSVKNSCAAGSVSPSGATSLIGTSYATKKSPVDVCINTYTLVKIQDRTNVQTNKKVTNNNYITDEAGALQVGFAAASRAEITAVFSAIDGWKTGADGMPIPSGCYPASDSSKYVPQAVTISDNASGEATDSNSLQADADDTASKETESVSENEDNENETVIKEAEYKMTTAELVLIVVLSSLTLIMIAVGAFVIVLIIKQKKKMAEGETVEES